MVHCRYFRYMVLLLHGLMFIASTFYASILVWLVPDIVSSKIADDPSFAHVVRLSVLSLAMGGPFCGSVLLLGWAFTKRGAQYRVALMFVSAFSVAALMSFLEFKGADRNAGFVVAWVLVAVLFLVSIVECICRKRRMSGTVGEVIIDDAKNGKEDSSRSALDVL